jgi:RNA polymerase sigma-70 factor, ECF subfamily
MLTEISADQRDSADPSDLQLAVAIAAGDQGAFRTLMQRYNRRLYRTALSIVRDESDAQDVVQNAYVLAFRKIGGFRYDSALSTWLVRIVINESLGCLRKRSRSPSPLTLDSAEFAELSAAAPPHAMTLPEQPEQSLIRADARRLIESKIVELPLTYRTVFMLRAVEELSVAEISDALGVPEATVRTRYFRARALLRRSLAAATRDDFEAAFGFAGGRCNRTVAAVFAALRDRFRTL